MSDGLILPAIVKTETGSVVTALLMNRKAYNKSIERKEIWIVHPETARVLPIDDSSYVSLNDTAGSFYEVVVADSICDRIKKASLFEGPLNQKSETKSTIESNAGNATLEKLKAVIAERRRTLPEGSYTTHLFQKGEEKIRKKTGEEAIELLLAQKPEEIISESADLIYHLMVLLEVKEISITAVLNELEQRMK